MDEDYDGLNVNVNAQELQVLFSSCMDDIARLVFNSELKPQYKIIKTADIIRRLSDILGKKIVWEGKSQCHDQKEV